MSNIIDFYKIKAGELGVVNFNNMIPVDDTIINEVIGVIKTGSMKDIKYKNLLNKQMRELIKHEREFISRAEKLYMLYNKDLLSSKIRNRCCNFKLLEEKSKLYKETLVKN